jgi:hypothetical protein
MKQKIIIAFLILSSFIANSQISNIVTSSEFDAIKINTTSLKDLKKTKGKQPAVEALLGAVTSYTVDENESYYYFTFKGLKIDFSTLGKSKPYIESFEVNTNESTFSIKDTTVTVGDDISKLGTVVFSVGRNGSKSILFTVCEDCDSFVNIEFNQTTNIITKISYMDMS